MSKSSESAYKRLSIIKRLAYWPARIFVYLKFRYRGEAVKELPSPFILISNHVTDWDPIFVGATVHPHMYYVASEHVYRQGFISKLLKWSCDPIARVKGSTDAGSAMQILRTLRKGHNVCIFAEGDRTWNGVTSPLHPSTVKLIRASKANLVTFRITGGYFTSPRWSTGFRKGRVDGGLVSIYTPDDIRAMSDEELSEKLDRDIRVDAYEAQLTAPVSYRGKRLAERLEDALYVCPSCDGVCTMKSEDDRFYCTDCGASSKYTEDGYLRGDFEFDTVQKWDKWQDRFLRGYIKGRGTLFSDGVQTLNMISNHTVTPVAKGELSLSRQGLRIGDKLFSPSDISAMSMIRSKTLVFTAHDVSYEIRLAEGGARKYYTALELLKSSTAKEGL